MAAIIGFLKKRSTSSVSICSVNCPMTMCAFGRRRLFLNSKLYFSQIGADQTQDIFEEQAYKVETVGLNHRSTLSTSVLIPIIQALIGNDFFNYSTPDTHFDLELHLRCVVASLRLLAVHGIQAGSGALKFTVFEQLYKRMPAWQAYSNVQLQQADRVEEKLKNYNNEFLIMFAQDFISSMPSDRSVTANITTRVVAAAAGLGHAVYLCIE